MTEAAVAKGGRAWVGLRARFSPLVFAVHSVLVWGCFLILMAIAIDFDGPVDEATDAKFRALSIVIDWLCAPLSLLFSPLDLHICLGPPLVFVPSSLFWAAVARFAGRRMRGLEASAPAP